MNTEYNKSTIKLKKLEKEMFSNIEKMGGGGGGRSLVKPFYNTLVQAMCNISILISVCKKTKTKKLLPSLSWKEGNRDDGLVFTSKMVINYHTYT